MKEESRRSMERAKEKIHGNSRRRRQCSKVYIGNNIGSYGIHLTSFPLS